jgi:hypothetical protein
MRSDGSESNLAAGSSLHNCGGRNGRRAWQGLARILGQVAPSFGSATILPGIRCEAGRAKAHGASGGHVRGCDRGGAERRIWRGCADCAARQRASSGGRERSAASDYRRTVA